mmetsp:Transcript_31848/g.48857  ORF Transcript_31848/g.48857 Transcript_31848/m.48857 type:complete len:387 (+) Transcript_31848:67-1227(+)
MSRFNWNKLVIVGTLLYCSQLFAVALANEESCPNMFYRTLGNTGMITSVLSFGFWATYGDKDNLKDRDGVDLAKNVMRTARQAGVNLFDNAEVYGSDTGNAEQIFGLAYEELQQEDPVLWRRSDLLITTKIFWGGEGQNENGLSRKHIQEGMRASLSRLKLSYVDIVFCHRPDTLTPTESVVRSMTELVRSGKAMSWGTSEWSSQQITEAFWIARQEGLEPPSVEQPEYHMFHRERVESEYHPMYRLPYNIGTTTWSPLASGLLTGKYNDGIPEGSRATQDGYGWLAGTLDEWKYSGKLDKVRTLSEYAKNKLGCSVAQLAIAWCIRNRNVSTVLLGATKIEQIEDNLGAIKVAHMLTEQNLAEIEDILDNSPRPYPETRWPNPSI